MTTRHLTLPTVALALALLACRSAAPTSPTVDTHQTTDPSAPVVYMTTDISAQGLVRIFDALDQKPHGRVAVKISTGESAKSNHLSPTLIRPLVAAVDGTLVECNTTYSGNRSSTEKHRETIRRHGYTVAGGFPYEVDIMDESGDSAIAIPTLADGVSPHVDSTYVGRHLGRYDFMINLAHFKGHAMGGFGGVLKNQSIGMSSRRGKALIHSAGRNTASSRWLLYTGDQDGFLESMAEAAYAIDRHFHREGRQIVYINIMNNMSTDCDCDGSPSAPRLKDIGILASTDPVALDQACIDLVFSHRDTDDDQAEALIKRINKKHGLHILDHAERIGFGNRHYRLQSID